MFLLVESDCNLSPNVFFFGRLRCYIDERLKSRQTADKYNIRKALCLTHRAGGLWADGIWKTGVFRRPNLPLFFSPAVLPLSLYCRPPTHWRRVRVWWGGSDTQTVIISPLEIGRRLGAFYCTLIPVIAYILFLKCIVTQS